MWAPKLWSRKDRVAHDVVHERVVSARLKVKFLRNSGACVFNVDVFRCNLSVGTLSAFWYRSGFYLISLLQVERSPRLTTVACQTQVSWEKYARGAAELEAALVLERQQVQQCLLIQFLLHLAF